MLLSQPKRVCTVLLLIYVFSGCEDTLEGPPPNVVDPEPDQPLPVSPGIVCRMQHPDEGTPVLVNGDVGSAVNCGCMASTAAHRRALVLAVAGPSPAR